MQIYLSEKGRDPYDGLRPFSALTHGLGALLSLAALGVLLRRAYASGVVAMAAVTVYGVSMLCLYLASTLYHALNGTVRLRLGLRKLDHVMIYVLIAGTYTPVCLIGLSGGHIGRILLAVVWGMALLGGTVTMLWIKMPRFLTALIYLVMGWTAIFAIYPLYQVLSPFCFAMLLLGGGLYSVGGVLYALKWPGRNNRYFGCHEIFHIFILLGSIAHFLMVYAML